MNKKMSLPILLLIGIVLLSSCKLTSNTPKGVNPTDTPTIASPSPMQVTTEVAVTETLTPTNTPEPTETNTPSPTATANSLINEFDLGYPAKVRWCSDQSCFSVDGNGVFKVLAYPDFNDLFSYTLAPDEISIDISPDDNIYVITKNNQDLIIRNWANSTEKTIATGTTFMYGEISPDGQKIMISSEDQWKALIYDLETGQLETTLTGFETAAPVYSVSFGQSNQYAIWVARATIQVSNIATNQIFPAMYHEDFITSKDMDSAATYLAVADFETVGNDYKPTLFIYNFKTGALLNKFHTDEAINAISISPDGTKIALSLRNSVSILDLNLQQFTPLSTPQGQEISNVLYSPNGDILLVTDFEGHLMFYSSN